MCPGTLMETFGIEYTEAGEKSLSCRMTVGDNMMRPGGIVHGGATMALIETVGSSASLLFMDPEKEVVLGQAEVRQTFSLPKVGTIAGAYVSDGKITRNAGARLMRDGIVIYTGHISSLKRFKDDAKEVVRGNECGVGLENYNDIKVGDIIEAFETVQEAATLE